MTVLWVFLAGLATGLAANRGAVVRAAERLHWARQQLARYETAVDGYEHRTERWKRLAGRYRDLVANGARIP